MDKKTTLKILLLAFAAFPLGQIPGLIFNFYYPRLPTIHIFDILVGILAVYFLFKRNFEYQKYKHYYNFLVIVSFSLLFSLNFSLVSFLYLARLTSYIIFMVFMNQFLSQNDKYKKTFLNSLLLAGFITAIFGLVQYLFLPDLRQMKVIGWDDHYFRLTSTFLDPAFTGIILVLSILLSVFLKKNKLLIVLLPALALTYSRASFLSLIFAMVLPNIINLFIFIPWNVGGEGVNLLRTNSIFAKVINYQQSWEIIKNYPLFGVGYNNICQFKEKTINACSGLDNSFLFILATTGIFGFFSLVYLITVIIKRTEKKYLNLILTSGIAVMTHSMFTNTLFYPWVIFWIAILVAVTRD